MADRIRQQHWKGNDLERRRVLRTKRQESPASPTEGHLGKARNKNKRLCGRNRASRIIFDTYHPLASVKNLGKHTLIKQIKLGFCICFTTLNCSNLIVIS